jgi:DNA invertase Pin-like site-specific DNA recombinase
LAAALDACTAGDVLTVWKLDRLGRTLLDLVGLVEALKARDLGLTGRGKTEESADSDRRLRRL